MFVCFYVSVYVLFCVLFKKKSNEDMFLLILQREKKCVWERERERERDIYVREKHRLVASHTWPTRDRFHKLGVCPDQDQTCKLLLYGTMLQPPEPLGQSVCPFLHRNLSDSCQAGTCFISSPPRSPFLFSRFYFCLLAPSATGLFTRDSLLLAPGPLWTF